MMGSRLTGVDDVSIDMLKEFDRKNVRDLISVFKKTGKMMIFPTNLYDSEKNSEYEMISKLFDNGILVVSNPNDGARIVQKMLAYKDFLNKKSKRN